MAARLQTHTICSLNIPNNFSYNASYYMYSKITYFTLAQYPEHVRIAASNVAKSLPPLPILQQNEATGANFVGK